MRGTSLALTIAAAFLAGTLMTDPAAGQTWTVTSVNPPVVGQSLARPVARITFNGTPNSGKTITDGLAFTLNTGAAYGQPPVTYEFDTAGNGVTAGRIAIAPTAGDPPAPTADVVAAGKKLVEVVNSDPTSPVWAMYWYSEPGHDYGISNGWLTFVWKYDNQYGGITNAEVNDPNDDMTLNSTTFSTTNPCPYRVFLRVEGTGLSDNQIVAKLRSVVDPTKIYTCATTVRSATFLTVKVSVATGVGTPPAFPPLGAYDLVLTKTGFPDVVFPNAITLVENLLDDPSVRAHASASDGIYCMHNAWDYVLGPYWQKTKPHADADGFRKGSVHKQIAARQYPFPTGPVASNDIGDNEHGSLQWRTTGDGVHRIWQTVQVNFAVDTPLTLTGLWAGESDHYPMTYGVQLRSGGPDGTIIAETPPGQKMITPFDWADFAVGGVFPAGTTQVTVVFYGDQPTTGAKVLHFDDLLLRVDTDHPTPPGITGMITPEYAAADTTNATVTLTGINLASGQTSVKLQETGVVFGGADWADGLKNIVRTGAFALYQWHSGDKVVLTGGGGVTLGEYGIASKYSDNTIVLDADINGTNGDITNGSVAGYIVKAPIVASGVSAGGSQVTASFDLTGAAAGYYNIIVEVGTNLPVIWRDGFSVVQAGPALTNGSFELPEATSGCSANPRTETYVPATDWNVRFWNEYMKGEVGGTPILSFRDDHWQAGLYDLPSCPAPELGLHYSSTATYNGEGTAQYFQTVTAEAGKIYTLSGFFGHSDLNKVSLSLLDGNSAAAPMSGASLEVLPAGSFQDWTFAHVTGTASGGIMTAAWEVENQGNDSPRVAWTDHLVLEECTQPVTVTSVDPYAVANDTVDPVTLTITGSGFSGGTPEVLLTRIGQTLVPTSVTVLNDTTITCRVTGLPTQGTQAFEVVVRNNGCIGSLPQGFVSAQTTILNEQFEDPLADLNCNAPTGPPTPNTEPVSYWNFTDQLIREGDVYPPSECPLLSCNCPEPMTGCAGGHYASMSTGEGEVEQAWQTLMVTPGSKCIFGGWFSWDGTGTVNIKLLDGYGLNGTVLGTLAVPHAPTGNDQWCYSSVEGYAIGHLVTVVWELADTSNGSPAAVHADYMTFETTVCHNPFADVDSDGDVDQEDFAVFQLCYTGPENTLIPAEPAYCACLDVDGALGEPDGDIDQGDLSLFENCASGPGVAADPTCDD